MKDRLYCSLCGRKANANSECPVHRNAEMDSVNPVAGLLLLGGLAGLAVILLLKIF